MAPWSGDKWHTGSAPLGLPVSAKAWQRQPPQSISRRSQERQGSIIQSVPRKRMKASELRQIASRLVVPTEGKESPGNVSAAWQGSALPAGVTLRKRLAHPPIQALGIIARESGTT